MITDTVERPSRAQVQWAKDRLSRSFLFLMPISFVAMVLNFMVVQAESHWLDWFSGVGFSMLLLLARLAPTMPAGPRRAMVLLLLGSAVVTLWVVDLTSGVSSPAPDAAAMLVGCAVALAMLGAGVAVMWPVRQAWNDHLARRTIDRARSRGQHVPA